MDVFSEYRQKLRTAEEAVAIVKSGDWVDYGSNNSYPASLDAALAKRKEELRHVKVRGNLLPGPIQIAECDPGMEHFVYHSWHCSAYERRLCDQGRAFFTPMVFRNEAWYYEQFLTVNVAMLSVAPMDRHGYFNLSGALGINRAILQKADTVILEVNEALPRIHGGFDESVHISEVDCVYRGKYLSLHPGRRDDPARHRRDAQRAGGADRRLGSEGSRHAYRTLFRRLLCAL